MKYILAIVLLLTLSSNTYVNKLQYPLEFVVGVANLIVVGETKSIN